MTKQYRVQGPVMLMLTTTAIDVDEELLNRCLVLTINESREQTQQIHAMQRAKQTLEGLLADTERSHIVELHRNVQRLLKPVHVVNPYAEQLTLMDDRARTRRDHMKYLTLIRAIAPLHLYQREQSAGAAMASSVNMYNQNIDKNETEAQKGAQELRKLDKERAMVGQGDAKVPSGAQAATVLVGAGCGGGSGLQGC